MISAHIYFESNLRESSLQWIDFHLTTHNSSMIQGFHIIQIINPNKNFMSMGNLISSNWSHLNLSFDI